MGNAKIHALLEDGPRAGQSIELDSGPNGLPPAQVLIGDPLGRDEESFDVEPHPVAATTYHLEGEAPGGGYRYRPGPDVEV